MSFFQYCGLCIERFSTSTQNGRAADVLQTVAGAEWLVFRNSNMGYSCKKVPTRAGPIVEKLRNFSLKFLKSSDSLFGFLDNLPLWAVWLMPTLGILQELAGFLKTYFPVWFRGSS